jgi:hypothetical protein
VVHHVVKELFVGRCSFQWQAVIGFVLHDVKLSNLFKINIIIVITGCWRPALGAVGQRVTSRTGWPT